MAQVINMRRLHMGCGESLRRAFPLAFTPKRRANRTGSEGSRSGVVAEAPKKSQRDESC